jgi:hypothetical protein
MANSNRANKSRKTSSKDDGAFKFHPAKIDSLFGVLDAAAFVDSPDAGQVAQFAGVDPRTAGKLLKNGVILGLLDLIGGKRYKLALPYPYKGSVDQKKAVVKESLVRMPLLATTRQFIALGDSVDVATRKAATVTGVRDYEPKDFSTLLEWAHTLGCWNLGS